jgi:hypothetical protein
MGLGKDTEETNNMTFDVFSHSVRNAIINK